MKLINCGWETNKGAASGEIGLATHGRTGWSLQGNSRSGNSARVFVGHVNSEWSARRQDLRSSVILDNAILDNDQRYENERRDAHARYHRERLPSRGKIHRKTK